MPHTSYPLRAILYSIAGAFCLVTISANAMFALGLGTSVPEKIVCVLMSVSADAFKCVAVIVCLRLRLQRRFVLAGASCALGLLCCGWSTLSALGFALSTRDQTAAIHAAASASHTVWTTTIERAGRQLAVVGHSRPPTVIEADLGGQLVPAVIWRRTAGCIELTLPESRDACAPVLRLRQELAAAQSAQALEERIDEARRQLATAPVVGLSADPQAAGLAALVGVEEPTLRRALALLLAVVVEAGSAFGFALAGAATANSPPAPQTGATSHTTTVPGRVPSGSAPSRVVSFAERARRRKRGRRPATQPDASLVRWTAQCLRRNHRGCIGARATYQSYCRWAEGAGVGAVTETRFGRFISGNIAAMGGKKIERRQGAFYVRVELIREPDQPAVRIAA